jgi:hypothetical protein
MKSITQRITRAALRLHRCNRGAEGLEKILIIGAIVLPLLGALFIFKDALVQWLSGLWGDVQSDTQDYQDTGNQFFN